MHHHKVVFIFGVLVAILVAGLGAFMISNRAEAPVAPVIPPEEVVCTMEAQLCPDGSYVGRQGPNCEFAQCPVASSTPASTTSSEAPNGTSSLEIDL